MSAITAIKRILLLGVLLSAPACVVGTEEDPSTEVESTDELADQTVGDTADDEDQTAIDFELRQVDLREGEWLTFEQWLTGRQATESEGSTEFQQDAPPSACGGMRVGKQGQADDGLGLQNETSDVGREDQGPDPDPWDEAYGVRGGPDPDPWHPYDP